MKCVICGVDKRSLAFQRKGSPLSDTCNACRKASFATPEDFEREQARKRGALRSFKDSRRSKLIQELGGRCACCGESDPAFLVIDHIHGLGIALRKNDAYGETRRIWRLVEAGTARREVQVLCANCNMAKERKGGCPHQLVPAGLGCDR